MKRRTVRKIKNFVKNTFVVITIIGVFCGCSWYETHYTKIATVKTTYKNVVTVKDEFGDEWEFEDDKRQYRKDDVVKMTMNSMGTFDNFYDDEIERVKKINN